MEATVLIVGAGGFIGGHIVEECVRRGWKVTCGVRATTSRRWLTAPGLAFLTLDYDSPSQMRRAVDEWRESHDGQAWQWVVWNLGATQCANFGDFNRINFEYIRRFMTVLEEADAMPKKLVFMSSLSAVGPGDEKDYTPLKVTDRPDPNTRYGLSKIKSETWLEAHPQVPWVILRPTGVYGPHDKDYMMMVDAVAKGVDFSVGFRRQMLTFIHVTDLARAVADALERAPLHHKYILSEARAYSQKEFREIVKRAVGKRFVIPVKLPLWMAKTVCAVSGVWAKARLKSATLNPDKYKILKQRNWTCDITDAQRDFGFSPQVSLQQGFDELAELYKESKKGGRK